MIKYLVFAKLIFDHIVYVGMCDALSVLHSHLFASNIHFLRSLIKSAA